MRYIRCNTANAHINYKSIPCLKTNYYIPVHFTLISFMCHGIGGGKRTMVFAHFLSNIFYNLKLRFFNYLYFSSGSNMTKGALAPLAPSPGCALDSQISLNGDRIQGCKVGYFKANWPQISKLTFWSFKK